VRRGVKVVVWIAVFGLCASAGAYVAAHTNPFPPGVEDPGARSTTPTSSAPAVIPRWNGTMRSRTEHVFHVGGSCVTTWRTEFTFAARAGSIRGGGVARLVGDASCDFPQAQVQTRAIRLRVIGTFAQRMLTLRFVRVGGVDPIGSSDLGGFEATVSQIVLRPRMELHGGARSTVTRPDGDLGTYRSVNDATLTCTRGC
jgi:hypothetical protein